MRRLLSQSFLKVLLLGLSHCLLNQVVAFELPSWTAEEIERSKGGKPFTGVTLLIPLTADSQTEEANSFSTYIEEYSIYETPSAGEKIFVTYEVLDGYQQHLQDSYLSDPQLLLTKHEASSVESYLEYHAEHSQIDIRVLLFDSNQELPNKHDFVESIRENMSESQLSAVIIYYLADPSRSQMIMAGDNVQQIASMSKEEDMAKIKALEKSNATVQLDSFLTQLSISIYWLEQEIASLEDTAILPVPVKKEEAVVADEFKYRGAFGYVRPYLIPSLILLVSVFFIGYAYHSFRLRRVYKFPLFDLPQRLGADYAAGVGAIIVFQNQQRSPSSQRDSESDFLSKF